MRMKEELELQRHGVTPAQFLAYVRQQIRKHKLTCIDPADIDLNGFRRGNDFNFYYHDDPVNHPACKAEKSVSRPYEDQTYLLNWDGTVFNQIMEFEFDDEKTGHGYFYIINTWDDNETKEEKEENKTMKNNIFDAIREELEAMDNRSAWKRGVTAYALELVDDLEMFAKDGYFDVDDLNASKVLEKAMLNGASDWYQYSWGGSALIYDGDIAERLCTPYEFRLTRNGKRKPNAREEWLDTQARALYQASNRVHKAAMRALEKQ